MISPTCTVPVPCTEGDVRLRNQTFGDFDTGYQDITGRVEICRNGVFGAICDAGWDDLDAQATCNSLGYMAPFYRELTVKTLLLHTFYKSPMFL